MIVQEDFDRVARQAGTEAAVSLLGLAVAVAAVLLGRSLLLQALFVVVGVVMWVVSLYRFRACCSGRAGWRRVAVRYHLSIVVTFGLAGALAWGFFEGMRALERRVGTPDEAVDWVLYFATAIVGIGFILAVVGALARVLTRVARSALARLLELTVRLDEAD
ncbi:MAG: hypothetical protein KKB50_00930 [Planctomycetes bacterium]|nr:hypothetical protein [Planctomycetota bacterium]